MVDTLPSGTHTVVLAIGDLNGIARGKRLQAGMWASASHGVAMANAIFQMDMTCDVWDTPYGNFDNGYPDIHIVPIPGKLRPVPWEPGVVLAVCNSETVEGDSVPVDPRRVLQTAIDHAAGRGWQAMFGVELEFYLLDPETQQPKDRGIAVYGPGALASNTSWARSATSAPTWASWSRSPTPSTHPASSRSISAMQTP